MTELFQPTPPVTITVPTDITPPEIIVLSGQGFVKGYATFFAAIHNEKTEENYVRALLNFFRYLKRRKITDLGLVDPSLMVSYLKATKRRKNKKGENLALATVAIEISAIRMFFRACVKVGALPANPAAEITPPKLKRKVGATPVIVPELMSHIINEIPLKTQADYRDRALICLMTFSFYRVSAALSMRVRDYYFIGDERWVKAKEKGSRAHKMPCHPAIVPIMDAYLKEADLVRHRDALLFPSSHGKSGKLNGKPYSRTAAWKMVNRRARAAGYHDEIGNHSLRATGITNYMNSGGLLNKAQDLAGHAHISTTMLYDRSKELEKSEEIKKLNFPKLNV